MKPNQLKQWLLLATLGLIGTIKPLFDQMGHQKLSALASMTQVSPAMKVFTAHDGYETFANKFSITIDRVDGSREQLTMSPELYQRLDGPYNRRNAYGATIAYGPLLSTNPSTRSMFEQVAAYSICKPGTLIAEVSGNRTPGQLRGNSRNATTNALAARPALLLGDPL